MIKKNCLGSYLPIIMFPPTLEIMDHILVRAWGKVHTTTQNSKFAKIFISGPEEASLPRELLGDGELGVGGWVGKGIAQDLVVMLRYRGIYTTYII
jgi:hypothetical protein